MATIAKDEILANGNREVTISCFKCNLTTKNHGNMGLTGQLIATNNKLSTKYMFKMIFAYRRDTEINVPENKKIVIFDENKKYCILQSILYPGGMTDYTRSEGDYNVFKTCHYTIDEANIELLEEVENARTMRIETKTSFIEVTYSNNYLNTMLLDSIKLAQEALLKTSDDILKL